VKASKALRARSEMPRSSHAKAILGAELHSKLAETRALVVGAGGIGCELREFVGIATKRAGS
jgi:molybdopterin/thiamine biosynthesis adenylyltransferase